MEIILGGTHGLGWELATQLREQGKDAYVIGRSYDESKHGNGLQADLSKREQAEWVADKLANDALLAVDSLFWAVGKGYKGNFVDQPNVGEMMDVNLTHPMIICQGALQKLSARAQRSDLVLICSTTGVKIRNDETTYATSKGAQLVLANNLRSELHRLANENKGLDEPEKPSAVRVTVFEPGGMKTPFWGKPEDRPDAYEDRFMNPADVAAFILGYLQQPNAGEEKMIEKPELDEWLATRQA